MIAMGNLSLFSPNSPVTAAMPTVVTGDPDGLRVYQRRAVEAARRHLSQVRATLGVLFTGAGKTTVGGAIVKHWPGKVLWLAHRDFLIQQARERLRQMTGELISTEKAEQYCDDSRVVVGSVATMRGKRLARLAKDRFDLIIPDEAHHAVSAGYRAIFDHFDRAKIFGITATPARGDKVGAWNVFDTEAFRLDVDWGIKHGYFCPVVPILEYIEAIDLSHVKTQAGDLQLSQLEEEIAKQSGAISEKTVKHMGDRPTIVYTPGVASAHAVAACLVKLGKTAHAVDQTTPDHIRRMVLGSFGKTLQFIVNCAIYTEGLDVPNARGIVIARPTKSESLYIQMAGRGGRPEGWIGQLATAQERIAAIAGSSKPNFILLDITGKKGKHDLVSSSDTLAGKLAPDIKKRVEKIIDKKSGTVTLGQAVSMALLEAEEDDRRKNERIARAAVQARIKSKSLKWEPLKKIGIDDKGIESLSQSRVSALASSDDIQWLKHNRLPIENMTSVAVKILKNKASEWYKAGLASYRQRSILAFIGAPTNVSFVKASEFINAWKEAGGGKAKLSQEAISSIMARGRNAGEEG